MMRSTSEDFCSSLGGTGVGMPINHLATPICPRPGCSDKRNGVAGDPLKVKLRYFDNRICAFPVHFRQTSPFRGSRRAGAQGRLSRPTEGLTIGRSDRSAVHELPKHVLK